MALNLISVSDQRALRSPTQMAERKCFYVFFFLSPSTFLRLFPFAFAVFARDDFSERRAHNQFTFRNWTERPLEIWRRRCRRSGRGKEKSQSTFGERRSRKEKELFDIYFEVMRRKFHWQNQFCKWLNIFGCSSHFMWKTVALSREQLESQWMYVSRRSPRTWTAKKTTSFKLYSIWNTVSVGWCPRPPALAWTGLAVRWSINRARGSGEQMAALRSEPQFVAISLRSRLLRWNAVAPHILKLQAWNSLRKLWPNDTPDGERPHTRTCTHLTRRCQPRETAVNLIGRKLISFQNFN